MLLLNEQESNRSNSTIITFQAQTPIIEKKEVFFLFSTRQILGVLDSSGMDSTTGNFDSAHSTTKWRGKHFPILSLEKSLGLPVSDTVSKHRIIVIREVYKESQNDFQDVYALCQLGTALRRWQLPIECQPVAVPQWIYKSSFLRGAYEMGKSVFLVPNLRKIVTKMQFKQKEIVNYE